MNIKALQFIKNGINHTSKFSAVVFMVFNAGTPAVYAELPVAHATIPWSNNVQILSQSSNVLHIGQRDNLPGNWLLNWQSFNISAGSRVEFHQPSATHIALNRIFQNDASKILGSIDANGRVYLINSNGFLFGENSNINVNSLVASSLSLNMSDEDFISGDKNIANIINADEAAFIGVGGTGKIIIDKGAQINAAEGGSVLMFASDIFNSGDINTSSGQTILAASKDKVYLTPSTDPALRGFLVEVETGGNVENLGKILSEKGNITLAGLAINQKGILKATSSVSENGSIRLLARDGAKVVNVGDIDSAKDELILGIDIDKAKDADGLSIRRSSYVVASRTGDVILHEGSSTIIEIDTSSRADKSDSRTDTALVTDSQNVERSRIEISGKTIRLEAAVNEKPAASIVASGAEVILHATSNPLATAVNTVGDLNAKDSVSKIILEKGSSIDVSGTTDTVVDMQRNELAVTLTANFLRDAPIQREGPLRDGEIKTVTLDIRDGTPLGDISELVESSVKRGISERLSMGGDVKILSQGGVLLDEGSEINISGGKIKYLEGSVTSSQLRTINGQLVDIADADKNVLYTDTFGEVVVKSRRWGADATRTWKLFSGETGGIKRFYNTYSEGSDAGSLTVQSYAAILDNDLNAGSFNGVSQREVDDRSAAGEYNIILPTLGNIVSSSAQSVSIVGERKLTNDEQQKGKEAVLQAFLDSSENLPSWLLQLQDDKLNGSGLGRLNIQTNGDISLQSDASLNLSAGGGLDLQGKSIDIKNDIRIASGKVKIRSFNDLDIKQVIDVSGNWVNDDQYVENRNIRSEVNLDGGSISLQSDNGNLLLTDASLLANGGAWLNATAELKLGDGGDIRLAVDDINGNVAELELGRMQAFAVARGGSLNITANKIDIATNFNTSADPGTLQLTTDFFKQNGFSDYTIVSNSDDLTLQSGAQLSATTQSLLLNDNFNRLSSADNIVDFSNPLIFPDYSKPTTNITLGTDSTGATVSGEGLRISEGSSIVTTAGSDISLYANRNIFMNGDLVTQGGNVSIDLNDSTTSINPYGAGSAIWLGEKARISTQGVVVANITNDLGRRTGTVINSGDVRLTANRGYVILAQGSQVNVSGTTNELDLPSTVLGNTAVTFAKKIVNADAGDIYLTAAEGMLINGVLSANAADASAAPSGLLSLSLDTANRTNTVGIGNTTSIGREIHLQQNLDDLPVDFLSAKQGSDINNAYVGEAYISNETIINGGFDRLKLEAKKVNGVTGATGYGAVVFEDTVNLQLGQSIEILSPVIRAEGAAGSQVNITAPYVLLGSEIGQQPHPDIVATSGNSLFNVQAGLPGNEGLLELMGDLRLQGISTTNLNSEGDIRLRGVRDLLSSTALTGSLETQGDLNLQTRQVYATTLSQFSLDVTNTVNGVMTINGGAEPTTILSAGSQLSLNAPVIRQSGVIKAPQGQINFNADQQLILADNSLTSVSGEGQLIPFGSTLGENRWVYPLELNEAADFIDVSTAPAKEINYQSPDVQVQDKAVVDISGGGDLYSWEFVPGIGGSIDNLLTENANGAFAVVPGSGAFGSYDHQYSLGENNRSVGEQIYLSGTDELAAGVYSVLPARYALLPGAYLVTPTENILLPSQILTRNDGAPIVTGQRRVAGTDLHDDLWTGYVIESGEDVRSRSQYIESIASQFFRDAAIENNSYLASMPSDAGSLNILAQNNLNFSGVLRGDAAKFNFNLNGETFIGTGRGSQVNIAANNLRVVSAFDENGGNQLLIKNLNKINADSLMLGGTRKRTTSGVEVSVLTDTLDIEKGVQLKQSELYLVAQDAINLRSGSSITSTGNALVSDTQINISGDGALLRASANNQIKINRSNESANPLEGTLNIETGSLIDVSNSLAIDSSKNTIIDGEIKLNGGSLNLGAAKISIGDSNGVATGLEFTTAALNNMNAGELLLTSRSSVDLYGDLNLVLNNLQVEAASLNGYQSSSQQAVIAANTIKLSNPSKSNNNNVSSGSGNLILKANNIELGEGEFNLNGFNNVGIIAQDNINLSGNGAIKVNVTGDVTLDSTALTASSAAKQGIYAGNSNLVIKNNLSKEFTRNDSIGAQIKIQAKNLTHQGRIDLTSGYLSLDASEDLLLDSGSIINLSGLERDFAGERISTPGGILNLISTTKNISMLNGAVVDVSSGAGKGNAGEINVYATAGNVNLNGQLKASYGGDKKSASFTVDAKSIVNLSQLNTKLNSSGFNQRRSIRVRENSIDIGVSDSLVATDVMLQADVGSVNILGTIDAGATSAGQSGGQVYIAAGKNIIIGSTALLDASATKNANGGDGGSIRFDSRDGFIDLAEGSQINIKGSAAKEDGSLYLRASRDLSGKANIASIASDLQGVARIDIESYKSYDLSQVSITTALAESVSVFSDLELTALGLTDLTNVHQRKGIELTSLGDINLYSALDLFNNRDGAEAGVLTLRAGGDLNINADISDGFSGGRLQQGESWIYNFVAGADFIAASIRSVVNGIGDFNLAANKMLRTGSGDIFVASGKDINLQTDAAIYTAGRSTGRGSYENVAGVGNLLDDFLFLLPQTEFPDQGGDLTLSAQGNINANPSSILISDWLYRIGDKYKLNTLDDIGTSWGIEFSKFKHGVAALGGGDVNVSAGGDINGLSVYAPTTGKQLGELSIDFNTFELSITENIIEENGQGDISISSGGNINQSLLFAANGSINVNAMGNIGDNLIQNGLSIISANTQTNISAGGDIHFLGANNFSLLPLSKNQQAASSGVSPLVNYQSFFSTYNDSTSINLSSLNGDIDLINAQSSSLTGVYNNGIANKNGDDAKRIFSNYPGSFNALAINGDINILKDMVLWPSASGDFSLLAEKNITGFNQNSLFISMLDIDPKTLPGIKSTSSQFNLDIFPTRVNTYAEKPVNRNNVNPVRIIANSGDIVAADNLQPFVFETNKQTEVVAGRDILNVSMIVQNNNRNDISLIQAGRDITYINSAEFGKGKLYHGIEVNGGGELQVLAGRNIDLGDQRGIVASGNNVNPALDNESASLIITAGLGAKGMDFDGFINQYFTFESDYSADLVQFMSERGFANLSFESALNEFKNLQEKTQRTFIYKAFTNEFTQSGIRAAQEQNGNAPSNELLGYSQGLDALETLFPGTVKDKRKANPGEISSGDLIVTGGYVYTIPKENVAYAGNLSMVSSAIQTQDNGGDIYVFTPGGFINVGLSVSVGKDLVEKGIITKGDGAIIGYSHGDVVVNQSRIQALNGGDISIWSTRGDINAGKGAKSALTIPPPRIIVDPESGAVTQVFDAVVQGSGIQTACFDANCVDASITLIAPAGVIDAGDAGIRSAGDIILPGTIVNGNQVEAGGSTSGNLGGASAIGINLGSLDVNSSGENAATELVAEDASAQYGAGSVAILRVEVMGLSGERKSVQPSGAKPEMNKTKPVKVQKFNEQVDAVNDEAVVVKPDLSMNAP